MIEEAAEYCSHFLLWLWLKIYVLVDVFFFNVVKKCNLSQHGYLRSTSRPTPFQKVEGSLYQLIEKEVSRRLAEEGDWTVIKDVLKKEELKASVALSLSKKFAVVLKSMGFVQGDCLHIVMNNDNAYLSLVLAVMRLGGTVSCGDPALKSSTLQYQIEELKARFVVCISETSNEVLDAAGKAEVTALSIGPVPGNCQDLMSLAKSADEYKAPKPAATKNAWEDCSIIFWSSGTTGRPKGICHSQQTLWSILHPGLSRPKLNFFFALHYFHIGGFMSMLMTFLRGATLTSICGKGFSLELLLSEIKQSKDRFGALVLGTHHYVQLSELDLSTVKFKPSDLYSVKMILPSGAAVPAICRQKLKKIFPFLTFFYNGYGQTEVYVISGGFQELRGLGRIFPGTTAKVVDIESRQICKPFEHGEICVRTNTMMLGYLNQPKSTYFDNQGFGMTGDIGYYDNNGVLHYVDRLKEVIKYCNNHTSPTELDDLLQEHPAVKESLVFGIKDPKVQELISAVVVLKDGYTVTEDDIVRFIGEKVDADYKKMRGKVLFRDSLPRNSMGKLLRREMRKWAEDEAATMEK